MDVKLLIPKPVLKIIDNLSSLEIDRVIDKLKILKNDPHPIGSIKLTGYENQYRLRIGDFRIRYLLNSEKKEIVIIDIAHRKDIYRKK